MLDRRYFKKLDYYPIVLVLIAIATHPLWFQASSILSAGDFTFHYIESARNFIISHSAWISDGNFGSPNIQLYFYPTRILPWGALALLGIPFFIASKITHLIPIALLGFLAPYYLVKRLVGNNQIAFVSALFYGSVTHFLVRQNQHLAIAVVMALAPLLLAFFMDALSRRSVYGWLKFGILYFLGITYEPRMMYLVTLILVAYAIFIKLKSTIKNIKYIAGTGILLLFANAFWILPTVFTSIAGGVEGTSGRPLFGDPLYSLPQAFTIFEHSWNGSEPEIFTTHAVGWYFWLIPLVAFASLIGRKGRNKKMIIFFAVISLIGVLYTKQSTEPFTDLFRLSREYIPGFELFRSASKLYFVTAVGYLGLIAFGLMKWRKYKIVYLPVAIMIVGISFINLKPMATGDLGLLTKSKEINDDYKFFKSNVLENSDESFKTLWLPRSSRWVYSSMAFPKVNGVDVVESGKWRVDRADNFIREPGEYLVNLVKTDQFNHLLDSAGIKYVAVPIQDDINDEDVFSFYRPSRDDYIEALESNPDLVDISGDYGQMRIFENRDYDKLISLQQTNVSTSQDVTKELRHSILESMGITNYSTSDPALDVHSVGVAIDRIVGGELAISSQQNMSNSILDKSVYKDLLRDDFQYSYSDGRITFRPERHELTSGEEEITFPRFEKSYELLGDGSYYLSIDNNLVDLSERSIGGVLGEHLQENTNLVSTRESIFTNGSFEDSLWRENVDDCHNYDDNPAIGMSRVGSTSTNGDYSLQLEATRHIACTYVDFPVNQGSYVVNFDYRSPTESIAGFALTGQDGQIVKKKYQAGTVWAKASELFDVKQSQNTLRLYLYSYDNNDNSTSVVNYDNLTVERVNLVPIDIFENRGTLQMYNLDNPYQRINLSRPQQESAPNLIQNGSFEDGLWQENVDDCHNYDENPIIGMSRNGKDSTDGGYSLQLEATRHIACTYTDMPIDKWTQHVMSFKVKSSTDSRYGYQLRFNDHDETTYSEVLTINKHSEWANVQDRIDIPFGATSASLYLYVYPSDDSSNNVVLFDELSLRDDLSAGSVYYAVTKKLNYDIGDPTLTYKIISPSFYSLKTTSPLKDFSIKFSQQFNKDWQLYLQPYITSQDGCSDADCAPSELSELSNLTELKLLGQSRLINKNHYVADEIYNGWAIDTRDILDTYPDKYYYLDENGQIVLNFVLVYRPQAYLYIGTVISLITAVGAITPISWYAIKQQRRCKTACMLGDKPTESGGSL